MYLDIVASALDGYSYEVLAILHGMDLYPLEVHDNVNAKTYNVKDEEEFIRILEGILSSPGVHKVISVLIAQSKA